MSEAIQRRLPLPEFRGEKGLMWILGIIYTVGISGIFLQVHPQFMLLTPVNLLVSMALVLSVHQEWRSSTLWVFGLVYTLGLSAELFGVQTGLLFGSYGYGATLGPKIMGTPWLIGLNWLMLVYVTASLGSWALGKKASVWVKAFFGASLMTLLDTLIEPVAKPFGFWAWEEPGINSFLVAPWQNYAAWWVIAFVLHLMVAGLLPAIRNRVADFLFLLQVIFFLSLHLFLALGA